jgi:hypothetical protein
MAAVTRLTAALAERMRGWHGVSSVAGRAMADASEPEQEVSRGVRRQATPRSNQFGRRLHPQAPCQPADRGRVMRQRGASSRSAIASSTAARPCWRMTRSARGRRRGRPALAVIDDRRCGPLHAAVHQSGEMVRAPPFFPEPSQGGHGWLWRNLADQASPRVPCQARGSPTRGPLLDSV